MYASGTKRYLKEVHQAILESVRDEAPKIEAFLALCLDAYRSGTTDPTQHDKPLRAWILEQERFTEPEVEAYWRTVVTSWIGITPSTP